MAATDESATIPNRFETIARRFAHRVAVRAPEATLTYRELHRAAIKTARHILRLGLVPENPIPVVPGDITSTLVAILGVLQAGRVSVCLDPSWPPARLADVLARLETRLVMTDSSRMSVVGKLTSDTLRCLLPEEVAREPESEISSQGVSPDAAACIIFTSGSTGVPNGVIQSHRNLVQYVAEQTRALEISARDRMPLLFPLSSMAGLMATLRALLNGATLVAFDKGGLGVEGLPEWVENERLTVFHSSPSLFRQLRTAARGRSQFSTVRCVYLSGEAATDREVEVFGDLFPKTCLLYNNLGCTEVSSFRRLCIGQEIETPVGHVPVGYAVAGKDVSLLDEAGREVEPGVVGEICVRSRYLSPGYWRNEELTRKRFPSNAVPDDGTRCYLTGDLGRMRSDGCLEYAGRKDHQVKIRGNRVETEAVDAAIRSLNQVEDAVVESHTRSDGESSLVAYVVAEGTRLTTSKLRRDLATVLPDHMIPGKFVVLESLPRLPGGKVDRSSLPTPEAARPVLETPLVLPRTPLERQMADVWAQVLGIDQVGLNDHFLDLGGDSLLAVVLVSEVERVTGRVVAVEGFGQITTIQAMAESVSLGEVEQCAGELSGGDDSWQHCRRRMVAAAAGSSVSLVRNGSTIAVINPEGTQDPLFWCFNGYDIEMSKLGQALGRDQLLYGLFSGSGVAPGSEGFIRTLAKHYAEEVESLQASGSLLIGGNCRGARVAFELADLLRARGREVGGLCFLEFFDPRLFGEETRVRLLYGRESHLKAYEPFRWGEEGWEIAFKRPPKVDWVSGAHGEFFALPNLEDLAGKIRDFLEAEHP